ncbi:DNA methyltransferase [Desulfonatronum sp. SC1]|uniref:DNA methyltransferase n=1 Tax=Desulfonatronum sp. SC1 TaxID=2109626 RepID=UPI000D2FC335|nr:DNA methyltransferase [Desulfonatronum sp. SC1]PTN37335.1 DNA methylase [Desulfonatronum sp. SC1]
MKVNSLFDSLLEEPQKPSGPVTCLGMTFENDEARRAHFTEELRKKLQDPEFRKIEGFPIGSDEDILNLSDPPYYTACPNPWIADFIAEWEAQKPEQPEGYHYHREPFAADVSEGKNDPIYNAHSYHTKVPHKAIMRYILHYTQPGDIVFDGFCGTGMTGVAAQMCGDREVVMSLGYQVKPDETILQEEIDEDGKKVWRPFSKLGSRRAVLNDLSPAATFIAYNYNTPVDVATFDKEVKRILKEVEKECGWMYETKHSDNRIGNVNYTIWSDVFLCGECSQEIVLWDAAVDKDSGEVSSEFLCPGCGASWTKRTAERAFTTTFDQSLNETIKQAKKIPVLINYSVSGKSYTKTPDEYDFGLLNKIDSSNIPTWFPVDRLMDGKETRRNDPIGITHSHHFYTKRNLWVFSSFLSKTMGSFWKNHFWGAAKDCQSYATRMIKINIKRLLFGGGQFMGFVGGTLYVPSLHGEQSTLKSIATKTKKVSSNYRNRMDQSGVMIGSSSLSSSDTQPEESIDYIFLDPPFGSNINYSELNFLWESWLKIWTNIEPEAIENDAHSKTLDDYRHLMTKCFREAYRVLKPGRWMTIEFSNTNAAVWNSIQTSLTEAGFIVANVSALDKKQGSFKAYTTPTAVKQDLVISAYKPNGGFEERFQKEAQTEEGVWDFVRTHLKYLPVTKRQGALMLFVPERDPRILFDQMIAFYVRKGYPVPISSQEFQIGLAQRFIERDGMYFLPDQVAEYDRKIMTSGAPQQLSMFVSDEASSIQWLRQLIREKPQTFSGINPQFMQQLGGWSKNEAQLDLRELLNQNFLCYDGKGPVPEQIHAYLSTNWKELRNLPKDNPTLVAKARDRWYVPDPNKAGDLEKLREKALLKEFEEYKEVKKKLKVFRLEAVRAGFKKAWQERDYAVIVAVAYKIPNNVLEEDPKLLMWYDQAVTRMGGE